MPGPDSDDEDDRGRAIGFFFGNVNEDGQLEEDYLDEVWGLQLSPLSGHRYLFTVTQRALRYLLATAKTDVEGGLRASRLVCGLRLRLKTAALPRLKCFF